MSEETIQKQGSENSRDGVQPREVEIIRQANDARQRLAEENARLEKNLAELRELTARRILGGETEAGKPQVKAPEISPSEYAKLAITGKLNRK